MNDLHVSKSSGQFSVLNPPQSIIQYSWSLTPRASRTPHFSGFSSSHYLIVLSFLPGYLSIGVLKDSAQPLSLFSPQLASPSTKFTYSTLVPNSSSFPSNTREVVKLKWHIFLIAGRETCGWISSTYMHQCKSGCTWLGEIGSPFMTKAHLLCPKEVR